MRSKIIKEPHPHGSDPQKVRQKQEFSGLNGLNPVLHRVQAVSFSLNSAVDAIGNSLFKLLNRMESLQTKPLQNHSALRRPKKFSSTALSRQVPFRDMLCVMPSSWHTKTPHLLGSNTILSNKWGAVHSHRGPGLLWF